VGFNTVASINEMFNGANIKTIFENSKLSDDFLMMDDERNESQRWTVGWNFLGAEGSYKD
jgi:hypothetical protein